MTTADLLCLQLLLLLLDVGGQDLFQPLVEGDLQGAARLRLHGIGIEAKVEIPDALLLALCRAGTSSSIQLLLLLLQLFILLLQSRN